MSSGIILLPSVNRSLPRVVAQSPSGIVAYACRYHIYFIDARANPPLVLDSKFIYGAHPGKIISLSFCKHEGTELLASIGDDREIKIWNTESQTCISVFEVKEYPRVSEWIYGSSNTLVFQSDFKIITKWNFEKGLVHGIHKIKTDCGINATQIVSNEKSPHLLAIGYTNGTIIVMDIVQESILQKLKIHSNEITSLSWSPVIPDILLSASLDLSLRMWKMGEAQPKFSYYLHAGRHKNDDKKKLRIVGICHPTDSNTIICSNLRGDVGEIVFAESETPKFEHEKPKFSYYYQGSCDISCKSTFAFLLVSADDGKTDLLYCFDPYKITLWNVTKKQLTFQIPFMSQFVYDLTISNVNPNLLAISNGEGILKVWNSQSEATRLDTISAFVHFKVRIMTAAWHPITENIIAYGTDEGRVGIIDIVKRKVMYSFETHHTDAVYCLNWGPCDKAPKSESEKTVFYIYSVGGGVIYIHKENDAKGKALNFDDLAERPSDLESSEKICSEIRWRLDHSSLCVGTYKGYIDIYDNKFLFLKRFNTPLKSVECLRWHPLITYMSPDGSHLKSWLACCGSDMEIYIIDTSSISEENSTQGSVKKLVGHKKRIVSLCWSPHKDGFLASASKDGSALVWDVPTGSIIATYLHHQDVVYAVQWSVFEQDIIYSGGQDGSVRMWKISEQTVVPVPDKAPVRKKMKKPTTATTKISHENYPDENADRSVTEKTNRNICDKAVDATQKDFSLESASYNKKPLFPHYSMSSIVNRDDNLDDCIKLTDILSPTPTADLDSFDSLKSSQCVLSNEDTVKFGLFADQLTALRMIETQRDLHRAEGDHFTARYLQLMTGNVQSTLEEAAANRGLTHFLVSIAPSVSYSFWLEMCEKYAVQLVSDHSYNQASFYYLACGKIYEAINVLSAKGHFVEALALAKSRLPESDPIIPKLVAGLLKKFRGHSLVGEAMCYLSSNEPLVAAKTMASKSEPNYVRVAAYICRKFNLDEEADEYRFSCVEKCLMKYDYSTFKQLIQQEPCLQVYNSLAVVHEALHRQIQLLKKQDALLNCIKDMFAIPKADEVVHFWKGSICKPSEQSFIVNVSQQLTKELLDTEKSSLLKVLDALEILTGKRMSFGTFDVHTSIAIYLVKFIILSILEESDAATVIFLKIFEASFNVYYLPKIMCSIFFPVYLSWKSGASRMVCTDIVMKENKYNSILENIHKKMAENITNYTKQPIETFIVPDDLQSNLRFITDRIGVLLSIKKVEEYLLAYFMSSIINDLMRLIEKKDMKLKCNAVERKTAETLTHSDTTTPSTLTKDSLNSTDIPQQTSSTVSETTEDDIVNKLIKLAMQEAEEKAKSLAEQGTIETNPSPDDTNSGDIRVESESCNIPFENSEEIVGDSQRVSNDGISPEKVVAGDEHITSNDAIIPKVDVPQKECIISGSNKSEVHQISDNTNSNDIPENDVNVISEVDPSNNETIISNTVNIPEVDISNIQHGIHTSIIADVDQAKQMTSNADITEEMILQNNENAVIKSNLDQPSQEILISSSVITEKIVPPIHENVDQSSNEDMHIQCLQSIDMFYNIVSFVTQSICKDEFALIYYLKEKVKLLNHIRASEELNKFSKEKKSSTKVGVKANKFKSKSNLQDPANLTEIINQPQDSKVVELDVKVVDSTVDMDNKICANVIDCIVDKVSSLSMQSIDDEELKNLESPEISPNSLVEDPEQDKLYAYISQEHNYVSRIESSEDSNLSHDLSKGICDKEVDDVVPSNLQNEIEEILGLIDILEKRSEKYHYPNPFNVIPKILGAVYGVFQKSPCKFVQEKLHELIHEIVSWAKRYFVGDINFVCHICQKTSVK